MKNIRLGEVLKEAGFITDEQLEQALDYQRRNRSERLGDILVKLGYVTEEQKLSALAKRLGLQQVRLDTYAVDVQAVARIPKALALKYGMIAIAVTNGRLTVATDDPLNFYAIEDIRLVTSLPVVVMLAAKQAVLAAIDYYYAELSVKETADRANLTVDTSGFQLDTPTDIDDQDAAPVVQLLNSLLVRGYNTQASDIHIEPFEEKTVVRMRVDGMIVEAVTLTPTLHQPLIARTKILANLDIAEKRVPQDGHFKTTIDGFEMNVRVSVIPTVYGEKAVLRFLSVNTVLDHSGQFGMDEADYRKMLTMLQNPHGILYITGPTGSGKTTTLYMVLEHLSKNPVNISTIEDPVERHLPRVNQVQVNNVAGLTFDVGLRALLRQDPDIIMVGETRDNETASIAVRAAITGHLVLSTLHTNDAVSSIVRLIDMGVEPYLVANSLVGVVSQRLVRKICPHCKTRVKPEPSDIHILGHEVEWLYKGEGCHLCNGTGYRGRLAVHEIVAVDRAIRKMIADREPVEQVYAYVESQQKVRSLRMYLTQLVEAGITSMEELLKLTYYVE